MGIFKHYTPEVESATQAIQVLESLQERLSRGEKQGMIGWLRLCCVNLVSPLIVSCFLSNVNRLTGTEVSHQEVQQIQTPKESLHPDPQVVYGPGASNVEYCGQARAPDPLSEDWFSRQALNFDFQDYI